MFKYLSLSMFKCGVKSQNNLFKAIKSELNFYFLQISFLGTAYRESFSVSCFETVPFF